MNGERKTPCERYADLSPALRRFLESMDETDVKVAEEMLTRYKAATTISKFLRWLVITTFLVVTGIWTLGEKIMKLFGAKSGGGG